MNIKIINIKMQKVERCHCNLSKIFKLLAHNINSFGGYKLLLLYNNFN